MRAVLPLLSALSLAVTLSASGVDSVPGPTVSTVITVESKNGAASGFSGDNLRVEQNRKPRPVTALQPLDNAPTQLLMLVDDSAGGSFDTQLSDVKAFINALPSNFEIAIGYMHNGTSQMVTGFTSDHAKAADQVRIPMGIGGADISPYDSLAEACKKWPEKAEIKRREVVMISSGLEGLGGGPPPENPYVNAAITEAQKTGVVVYAIYNPSSGHDGHSFWRATWGQNFLSQLTDETGGELYQLGFGSAVSFQPYFADILARQKQQYIVSFEANAESRSGLYQVKIASAVKGASVAAPNKVYVKAGL